MNKIRHLSLRIDDEMLRKFRYVCAYDQRSANGQLLIFIRSFIAHFEDKHGKIVLEDTPNVD